MAIGDNRECPHCRKTAQVVAVTQPGYEAETKFTIVYCGNCDTSHAEPLEVRSEIYEHVYAVETNARGYDRYQRYADAVQAAESPLALLAQEEDVYWAVKVALEARPYNGGLVLDVGSGLGYMTFALRSAEYDAQGLDLSEVAVTAACERYGPHYVAGDIFEFGEKCDEKYEIVVMTEVVEHLSDPVGVLSAVKNLLAPGGSCVLTTPNKSNYPPTVLWETEPPPVHLWWFSERSVEMVAAQLGMEVSFVDFSKFNQRHYQTVTRVDGNWVPTREPRLDSRGCAIERSGHRVWSAIMRRGIGASMVHVLRRLRGALSPYRVRLTSRSLSLCAVLTKPRDLYPVRSSI